MNPTLDASAGEHFAGEALSHATPALRPVPIFFLVSYVEERLWWPIQSPKKVRKKKAKS